MSITTILIIGGAYYLFYIPFFWGKEAIFLFRGQSTSFNPNTDEGSQEDQYTGVAIEILDGSREAIADPNVSANSMPPHIPEAQLPDEEEVSVDNWLFLPAEDENDENELNTTIDLAISRLDTNVVDEIQLEPTINSTPPASATTQSIDLPSNEEVKNSPKKKKATQNKVAKKSTTKGPIKKKIDSSPKGKTHNKKNEDDDWA